MPFRLDLRPARRQAKLESGGEVRIADIGCGVGWSSIQFAHDWPNAAVEGIDNDKASTEAARGNARDAGVADRVTFSSADGRHARGSFDLVTAFECVHDMSQPVEVLAAMLELAGSDGGTVLIMDEKADEVLRVDGDPVQRLLAGASVLHCLPAGRSETPSAATGTLLKASTLARLAREAGFREVTVLPIEHHVFRFYRLDP
ncbi:MAG: methyltransferase domain-containing protein [Actinobacteria bacterium ATB1]|nr:methyltransferase domain-containing protein [Actinobacteria bacterium ATB1]